MSDYWIGKLASGVILVVALLLISRYYRRQTEATLAACLADLAAAAGTPPRRPEESAKARVADAAALLADVDPDNLPADALSGERGSTRWRAAVGADGSLTLTVTRQPEVLTT